MKTFTVIYTVFFVLMLLCAVMSEEASRNPETWTAIGTLALVYIGVHLLRGLVTTVSNRPPRPQVVYLQGLLRAVPVGKEGQMDDLKKEHAERMKIIASLPISEIEKAVVREQYEDEFLWKAEQILVVIKK